MTRKVDLQASIRGFTPPDSLVVESCLRAYEEISCPRSLTCAILLRAGDVKQLSSLAFNPMDYNTIDAARRAFMATELLRKYSGWVGIPASVRRSSALQKAQEAERTCLEANRRLIKVDYGGENPRLKAIISMASAKIHSWLPDYNLGKHLDASRWGPGSDVLVKRPFIGPYHKYHSELRFTRGAAPFVACLMERYHLWARWLANPYQPEGAYTPFGGIYRGNEWTTVPKTALIDRSICIEPGANVFLQLGVGQILRTAARRAGIDLTTQERNRMLALEGSSSSEWATIDLSSASDTIARYLVWMLFNYSPKTRTWFKVMDSLRSKFTYYGEPLKRWELNEKFSSMGNGFTFELETLVFKALADTVAEREGGICAAVYGDDIIVTRDVFQPVCEVLQECGFLPNPKKSYSTSYFRESCGMNAWDGYELASYRLVSLKSLPEVYSFHNGLTRIGLTKTAGWLQRRIPAQLRFFGPSGAGDAVLHSSDVPSWYAKPYGIVDQWYFWGMKLRGLKYKAHVSRVSFLEPALLHSLCTSVPLSDHTVYTGGRWGSEGLVTLSKGEWTVGSILVGREALGLGFERPPG